jgi:hypothetical protein
VAWGARAARTRIARPEIALLHLLLLIAVTEIAAAVIGVSVPATRVDVPPGVGVGRCPPGGIGARGRPARGGGGECGGGREASVRVWGEEGIVSSQEEELVRRIQLKGEGGEGGCQKLGLSGVMGWQVPMWGG